MVSNKIAGNGHGLAQGWNFITVRPATKAQLKN